MISASNLPDMLRQGKFEARDLSERGTLNSNDKPSNGLLFFLFRIAANARFELRHEGMTA